MMRTRRCNMHFSKYKRLAGAAGVVVAAYIALCPHVTHKAVGEHTGRSHHETDAIEAAHAHHDHEHCEFDATHSHDFLMPKSVAFKPVPKFVSVVHANDHLPRKHTTISSTPSALANLAASSLKTLDTIRLRI